MRVIPKRQKGGSMFDQFFTIYTPVRVEAPRQTTQQKSSGTSQSSEKGRLTEKDFFDMLKDIDGLPNEMNAIVSNLMSTFQMSNLTGIDSGDLATMYLQNLFQIKVASQNKAAYDKVIEQANKNGAMAEPAISMDGKLVVQNADGKITTVSLIDYFENKDQYAPLTVSNLANLRAYSPELAYKSGIFDIINNSVGFESFQKLLDQAQISLGSNKYSEKSITDKQALQGLEYLQSLPEERKQEVLNQALDGNYTYLYTNDSNIQQVQSLINYLQAVIPDRMKTWAAWKLQTADKETASRALISEYLSGRINTSRALTITAPKATSSSSKSSAGEDPKEGQWVQMQVGRGGNDSTFSILNNRTLLTVNGKYYGDTPGLDKHKSFNDYLADSGIRKVIKNMNNITFGDTQISSDSYNDMIVDANGGAMMVTLPITPEGKVDFSVLDTYTNIDNNLRGQGLKPDSLEYNTQLVQELVNNGLGYLIDAQNGTIDMSKFGHFLVLRGLTNSKAKIIKNGKKTDIDDANSQYMIDSSDDSQLYDIISQTLSNKETGEYKLDPNDWWIFEGGWDRIYSGNIFIPISMNTINGMNADENDIKSSTALQYEQNMQQIQKANNQRPTGSDQL